MKPSLTRNLGAKTIRIDAEPTHHYPHASYNQLFTVQEAFVRLNQSGQTGELMVLNQKESFHVFVEKGFVVYAEGQHLTGEAALRAALSLHDANFVWVASAHPVIKDLYLDIREYLVRYELNRDQENAQSIDDQKRETLALPRDAMEHPTENEAFETGFFLVPETNPEQKMALTKPVNLVGREVYCDWVIDDRRISRKHCMLQITGSSIRVRDLESTNGTVINGVRTSEGYLRPGDTLTMGGYVLTLRQEKAEPEATPMDKDPDNILKTLSLSMV
jgi:pSer/pThr/pTyr-binding forkhead associated (FHA) protein